MLSKFTVIVPTYNEAENIEPLVRELERVLKNFNFNILFVDDNSPDGTAERVEALARHKRNISCLKRENKRGLSSAVLDGVMSCNSHFFAVIDGDLQHDTQLLPIMFDLMNEDKADLIIASRYISGGDISSWRLDRKFLSVLSNYFSSMVLKENLSDPMSGFFACKTKTFIRSAPQMSRIGFKVLFDYLISTDIELRITEIPLCFKSRNAGSSKLNISVAFDFLKLLLKGVIKTLNHRIMRS